MPIGLAPGVSFGHNPEATIVLDLYRDRYSRLGPAAERALKILAGGGPPETCESKGIDALFSAGLIAVSAAPQQVAAVNCTVPLTSSVETSGDLDSLAGFPRVCRECITVAASLRLRRLAGTIDKWRRVRAATVFVDDCSAASAIARSYVHWRLLVPVMRSCIPDSLALSMLLTRRGIAHDVVFGVTLLPFAAHAWVQTTEAVLSDRADRVRGFLPVFLL